MGCACNSVLVNPLATALRERAIESRDGCDAFVAVFYGLEKTPLDAVYSGEGGPLLLEKEISD